MLAQCPKCRGCKCHPLQSQESGESDESWEHNADPQGILVALVSQSRAESPFLQFPWDLRVRDGAEARLECPIRDCGR